MIHHHIRAAMPADCERILAVTEAWWGRPYTSDMLSKVFLTHFHESCLIADSDSSLLGFLIGFLSQSYPAEAYIRLVMVHPQHRRSGIGRALYQEFFRFAQTHGRTIVRCVTAPTNTGSLAFHRRLGFDIELGDTEINHIPVCTNYDGRGGTRVKLWRRVSPLPE